MPLVAVDEGTTATVLLLPLRFARLARFTSAFFGGLIGEVKEGVRKLNQ
jgi:hypothetical protein